MQQTGQPIIFFDGMCGTCNHFVDLLLSVDKKQQFLFAPLQGETAKKIIGPEAAQRLENLFYKDEEGLWERSEAVMRIFKRLGGLWKGFLIFDVIPISFLNYFYDLFAKKRYLFGKKDTCRLPTPEEKSRFLP